MRSLGPQMLCGKVPSTVLARTRGPRGHLARFRAERAQVGRLFQPAPEWRARLPWETQSQRLSMPAARRKLAETVWRGHCPPRPAGSAFPDRAGGPVLQALRAARGGGWWAAASLVGCLLGSTFSCKVRKLPCQNPRVGGRRTRTEWHGKAECHLIPARGQLRSPHGPRLRVA